eukprot:TRINITY_DN4962_c0_g1_i1.p1 TRINITY_DN4962_c0_g1~~TRINITY_DN4962_c0_g1_i1.p1  ORF type:complete len:218 (-),score=28.63 TRINITY_DN4962_c0_g1_i1:79-684(-)
MKHRCNFSLLKRVNFSRASSLIYSRQTSLRYYHSTRSSFIISWLSEPSTPSLTPTEVKRAPRPHPFAPAVELCTPPEKLKVYSRQDVAKHCTADDCWIIIRGVVYNVTAWLQQHPGGEEIIIAKAGSDATEEWLVSGHTDRAMKLMQYYEIGRVDTPPRYKGIYSCEDPASYNPYEEDVQSREDEPQRELVPESGLEGRVH